MNNTAIQARVSWADLFRGAHAWRMVVLSGGVAIHAINLYVTTTVLPNVVGDIGGLNHYAWATTLFVIASINASALGAYTVRKYGTRNAYCSAALLFALGSAVCGLASTMPQLLAGRLLQGLGGGLLIAMPYVLMRDILDEALWPRALALFSGMWGIATLLGPAVGGFFAETYSWRTAFWFSVPVSLGFGLMAIRAFAAQAESVTTTTNSIPRGQLGLLTVAVIAVSLGSSLSNWVLGLMAIAASALLLGCALQADKRAQSRLLPRSAYVHSSQLPLLYIISACLAVTVTCTEIFTPLFLQRLHGFGPLAAGYIAASASAGWTLGAIWSATKESQTAGRCIQLAPWLCTLSLLMLCLYLPQPMAATTVPGLAGVLAALGLGGLGVGLAWPHLANRIMQSSPGNDEDLAAGSIMTVQLIATTFGAACAGFVFNAVLAASAPNMENAAFALLLFVTVFPVAAIFIARGLSTTGRAARSTQI